MTTPAPALIAPETVSCLAARRALGGVTQTQVRRLVSLGRLDAIGKGPARRITRESLDAEMVHRRKAYTKAHLVEIPQGLNEEKRTHDLGSPTNPGHTVSVYARSLSELFHPEPVALAELVSVPRAAALLGLPDGAVRRAIAERQIPAVVIGKRHMVDLKALRELLERRGAK